MCARLPTLDSAACVCPGDEAVCRPAWSHCAPVCLGRNYTLRLLPPGEEKPFQVSLLISLSVNLIYLLTNVCLILNLDFSMHSSLFSQVTDMMTTGGNSRQDVENRYQAPPPAEILVPLDCLNTGQCVRLSRHTCWLPTMQRPF